jgi:hypothetical protein
MEPAALDGFGVEALRKEIRILVRIPAGIWQRLVPRPLKRTIKRVSFREGSHYLLDSMQRYGYPVGTVV